MVKEVLAECTDGLLLVGEMAGVIATAGKLAMARAGVCGGRKRPSTEGLKISDLRRMPVDCLDRCA